MFAELPSVDSQHELLRIWYLERIFYRVQCLFIRKGREEDLVRLREIGLEGATKKAAEMVARERALIVGQSSLLLNAKMDIGVLLSNSDLLRLVDRLWGALRSHPDLSSLRRWLEDMIVELGVGSARLENISRQKFTQAIAENAWLYLSNVYQDEVLAHAHLLCDGRAVQKMCLLRFGVFKNLIVVNMLELEP